VWITKSGTVERNGGLVCRYYFKKVVLEHNHILTPSPSVTRQMTGHKLKEPAMDDMINVLHMSKVKHVNVMRVLKEQVGGQESMNITERDIQNRYI